MKINLEVGKEYVLPKNISYSNQNTRHKGYGNLLYAETITICGIDMVNDNIIQINFVLSLNKTIFSILFYDENHFQLPSNFFYFNGTEVFMYPLSKIYSVFIPIDDEILVIKHKFENLRMTYRIDSKLCGDELDKIIESKRLANKEKIAYSEEVTTFINENNNENKS